ncbi:SKP1-like protein 1 [Spinacia oleracea]|uniref:SKP1-like protein n=1 Tax=Spinacia oleracea TaxID=3562 RepID=A0A9R0I427_SPIOL|nr:SKP1-like protein 1 [Spinacia oleracea]
MSPSPSPSPSTSSTNKRKIKLRSSDGKTFEVEEEVAMQSETIKSMIEVVPIPEVSGKTLSLVIDYCNKNKDDLHDDLIDWALRLFEADQAAFFDLVLAAHYLKIKSLEDLTSKTVAGVIRGKSLEEIRQTFNINK